MRRARVARRQVPATHWSADGWTLEGWRAPVMGWPVAVSSEATGAEPPPDRLARTWDVVLAAMLWSAALSTPLQGSAPERLVMTSSPETLATRWPLASDTSQI